MLIFDDLATAANNNVIIVIILSTIILLLLLLLLLCLTNRQNNKIPLPPYPTSPPMHPILKNALDLPHPITGHHLDVTLLQWSLQYGTIFSFGIPLMKRLIVCADPAFAKYVIQTKNYPKSPTYADYDDVLGRQSLLTSEGTAWSTKRRLFNPGFSPRFLRRVVTILDEKCRTTLTLGCERDARMGEVTNMHRRATDFTVSVMARVVFGDDDADGEDDGIRESMRELVKELVMNQNMPFRKYVNIFAMARIQRLKMRIDESLCCIVRKRVAAMETTTVQQEMNQGGDDDDGEEHDNIEKDSDILSTALRHLGVGKGNNNGTTTKSLSKEEIEDIVSQLKTFYFAGHDTTSTLIAWTMWLLAQHPTVANKIRDEAREQLGDWATERRQWDTNKNNTNNKSSSLLPTYDDFQKCTYLQAVLHESLRLYPPAGTARYCNDVNATYKHENDGRHFRYGGCILYVNQYVMHRHPDLWDDPNSFRPERFLGPSATTVGPSRNGRGGASAAVAAVKFMPFSGGKRDCIGKHLAMLEAKMAVVSLVLRFDAVVVDEDEEPCLRITSQPKMGAKVRFSVR